MKQFNIGTALVIIPFAHVLLASTYLYSYCFGFGANISSFVAASDIFATSIRSIAPLYALIVISALFVSYREIKHWFTTGHPFPKNSQANKPHHPLPKGFFSRRWMVAMKFGLLAVTIFPVFIDHLIGRPVDLLMPMAAFLFVVIFSDWLVQLKPNSKTPYALLVGFIVLFVVWAGITAGQENRHATFAALTRNNSTCGDFVVVRRFSDLYLALGRDGQHRMIDKDCKVKFAIPRVKPTIKTDDLSPSIRWLFT